MIFNGFDENVFKPQTIKTEKFTITYTGRIYNLSIRNPLLFFEGIQELLTENPDLQKDLQIELLQAQIDELKGKIENEQPITNVNAEKT